MGSGHHLHRGPLICRKGWCVVAYALASRLLRAVKASGLPFTQVGGWQSRGHATMGTVQTITLHHTATPRSLRKGEDYPTLNVVKNGRPGLSGPLAQLGLGRSGRVYLIAAGLSYHAGVSRATSMTNKHAIGIEAEGSMESWPQTQYDAYVRLVRALLDEFGLPESRALRHAETCSPKGRKNDASFSGPKFRRDVKNVNGKPPVKNGSVQSHGEGLFGMSVIATGKNDEARVIKPGQKTRIKVSKVFTMADVRTGQTVRPTVRFAVKGAHEEDVLHVQGKIIDFKAKDKVQDKEVGSFFAADYHGRTGGDWSDWVYVGQPYHVGQVARKGGQLKLQVEVENRGKNPITVHTTEFTVEGD